MHPDWKKIIRISLLALAVPVLFIITMMAVVFSSLQSKKELQEYKNAIASVVLSDEGELVGKIFTQNRTNIEFNELPQHLIHALLATEDIRFYEHRGTDSRSLLRVFFKTILFNKDTGGGSTISQQLAKNMFGRKKKNGFSIITTKMREALLARRLESIFSKNEILTMYLNTVPFGENVYGIEAASQRYFGKKVEELGIQESAVLIGMLKANNLYNPRLNPENSLGRRNVVIRQMSKYAFIKESQADSLQKLPLELNYANLESQGPADYFIYQVKKEAERILKVVDSTTGKLWNLEQDGLIIKTTLNLYLQEAANKAFQRHLSVMQKRLETQYESRSQMKRINHLVKSELEKQDLLNTAGKRAVREVFRWNGSYIDTMSISDSLKHSLLLLQAGLIAMDPKTGAVKAWVGGIDFRTQPYDQILARRQVGSTFKPLLFATALEQGFRPCDYLNNDSVVVTAGEEFYSPQNFDLTYGGKYSLTGALVHSMNVPAFNLFVKVGFDSLNMLWKNMGFSFDLDNTPSLPLGTAEASLQEMAVAYSVFANGGYKIEPYRIVSIESTDGTIIWEQKKFKKKPLLSQRTVTLINAMLQKVVNEGTGGSVRSVYGISIPLAGKTGTSQDYTDAWFSSYNPGMVIISRVGASLPSIHFNSGNNGSGSALALPLVALTIRNYIDSIARHKNMLLSYFSSLQPDMELEMLCPDYKEDTGLDEFLDIFRNDRMEFDREKKVYKKKRSFLRDLFRRR